ncbi:hypothetical protein WH50_11905 [Pokkaliibacter plantistimulans]|uniref:Uncharacterized protein n=1 Tax=Pokkaliibacter plantistimulans TaxID=1635171 RepID=A0ABX5M2F8_9GAMM|nr:hypothetical protein [Pokkaliibacter plantistimulans]PXF31065.1 hypothetical protein WH50_11905 [Pokkaliibacter plantistimulans]
MAKRVTTKELDLILEYASSPKAEMHRHGHEDKFVIYITVEDKRYIVFKIRYAGEKLFQAKTALEFLFERGFKEIKVFGNDNIRSES